MQYLYFPSCKLAKADIINSSSRVMTLHLKSKLVTPKNYPSHEILAGKAEFFFSFDLDMALNNFDSSEALIHIFGPELFNNSFKNIKTIKKHDASALCLYEPSHAIICEVVAIGEPFKPATLFKSTREIELSRKIFLDYELSHPSKKTQLVKI